MGDGEAGDLAPGELSLFERMRRLGALEGDRDSDRRISMNEAGSV